MIKSTRNEDENCRIVHNTGFNSTCCHFNILCQQAVYEYLDCQGKVTGVTGKLFSEHLSVDSKYSPRKDEHIVFQKMRILFFEYHCICNRCFTAGNFMFQLHNDCNITRNIE